jgi:hypothetical protein
MHNFLIFAWDASAYEHFMDYSKKIRPLSSPVTDTTGCRVPFSASLILITSDNNHHCILLLFPSYHINDFNDYCIPRYTMVRHATLS